MDTITIKEEVANRYKYLYTNSKTILRLISILNNIDKNLLKELESFLLGDTNLKDTTFYMIIEQYKKNIKIDTGDNESTLHLLETLKTFINNQESSNKFVKLEALKEYYNINAYKNDGVIPDQIADIILKGTKKSTTNTTKILADKRLKHEYNNSLFSESDKQDIYLSLHDELPWNLSKLCEYEQVYYPDQNIKISRPKGTKPCKELFQINEKDIFINKDDYLYRYFTLCPHCGFIVNIPKEILPSNIKKRIENRYLSKPNIYNDRYEESRKLATKHRSEQFVRTRHK